MELSARGVEKPLGRGSDQTLKEALVPEAGSSTMSFASKATSAALRFSGAQVNVDLAHRRGPCGTACRFSIAALEPSVDQRQGAN